MDIWIYLLLFSVIICLILFFMKKNKEQADDSTMELIQSFANEMVKENDKLVQQIVAMNQSMDKKLTSLIQRIEELEERQNGLEKAFQLQLEHSSQKESQKKDTVDSAESSRRDVLLLQDRYKEVFLLYKKGIAIEEISKKLGYGKGDIELILQLAGPIK